ncbi:MAG TPA: hypothetical protein VMG58_02345 [Candidatus Sulfotelmatobacter sp.]|nr:hypothetical protein [Candidatus Sulfotelmatobacter sp.]
MLRFAKVPDPVFLAVVDTAIGFMLDHLDLLRDLEEDWADDFPNAAKVFSIPVVQDTLPRLRAASREPALYQLTDYHLLLLYDALKFLSDNHNGLYSPKKPGPIGPYEVGKLDFPALVDQFFWGTDSLPGLEAGPPQSNDLELVLWKDQDEFGSPQPGSPAGAVIPRYPDSGAAGHPEA